jgi:hypothetical protein
METTELCMQETDIFMQAGVGFYLVSFAAVVAEPSAWLVRNFFYLAQSTVQSSPLEFTFWLCGDAGGDGLFMVVDEGGTFREDNFQKAVTQLNDAGADGEWRLLL